LETSRRILTEWLKATSSRRLTRNNPQTSATLSSPSRPRDKSEELSWKWNADTLPRCPRDHRHQDRAGPGTSLRSCCVTRTLNTAPTAPAIIAAKTKHAKSQKIAMTRSKKKHDQSVVNSKFKRIATQVSI
jgi:hypothetical protein